MAARRAGGIGEFELVGSLGGIEGRTRFLTHEEAESLMKAVDTPRTLHLLVFTRVALASASRPGPVLELKTDQVVVSGDALILHLNPFGRQQTNKKRPVVRIEDPATVALIKEACSRSTSGYLVEWAGKPIKSIKKAFATAMARAGFPDVTPYVLRHTAATWMAQAGVPLWEIADYLGHSDTRMVEKVYAHHHPDHRKKSTDAMTTALSALPTGQTLGLLKKPRTKKAPVPRKVSPHNTADWLADGETSAPQNERNPQVSLGVSVVGVAGIEPATPTMST
ncbi:site-specific integrase [Caenispirillum salinarum]